MILSLLSAVLALAAPNTPQPMSAGDRGTLDSLVAAERAFSRRSVEHGMRDAFLANLAEDGVIFQPLPINGRRAWQERPASPATLIWEPGFAEIAAAGDLGYTTGPWELRPPVGAEDRPVLHGHFVSVWQRAPEGGWKVALDLGITHPALEPGVGSGAFSAGPRHEAVAGGDRSRVAQGELTEAERRFSAEARRQGLAAAITIFAADDLRFNRDGHPPARGPEAARALLAADSVRTRWSPMAVVASRSGDLGYSYGVRERLAPTGAVMDTSVFLDVWRRSPSGRWQLAMAVDNPVARRGRP